MDKSLFMKTGALFCLGASILLISKNDLLNNLEKSFTKLKDALPQLPTQLQQSTQLSQELPQEVQQQSQVPIQKSLITPNQIAGRKTKKYKAIL